MPAAFVVSRALETLSLAVLLCSAGFIVAAILGLVLSNRSLWGIALGLIVADLLLGAMIAILDHMGYGQ